MTAFIRLPRQQRSVLTGFVVVRSAFGLERYDLGTVKATEDLALQAMHAMDALDEQRDWATMRAVRLVEVTLTPEHPPKRGVVMTPRRVVRDLTDLPFPPWTGVYCPELDMEIPDSYRERLPDLLAHRLHQETT